MNNKFLLKLTLFFGLILFKDIKSNVSVQEFTAKNDPLLVVVLMVKNEEEVINATLEPFIKAGIDSYFIYDTGSEDKTVQTVRNFFEKNKIINAYIVEEPWIDYAASRNRALDLAKEKFPNSTFMLMPDAEWYIQNADKLVDFCKKNINDFNNLYLIKVINNTDSFGHGRLIRTKSNVRFTGRVHEVIACSLMGRVPDEICFDYKPRQKGIEASARRWKRDAQILQEEVQKNPKDSRSMFYLAQTYECLGDLYNAYKYYEMRSKLIGWHEEDYETWYRLGGVVEGLSHSDKKFTKEMAHNYYMKAHTMSPHRAEPLIKIAELFWPSNYSLCFKFARMALDLPYPKDDVLFVNKEIYEYSRYDVISKCAWYVDEFELGEYATRKAIDARPYYIHLYNNLKLYLERKNKHLLNELAKVESRKYNFSTNN